MCDRKWVLLMVICWGRTCVLTSVEAHGALAEGRGVRLAQLGGGGLGDRLLWLRLQKKSLGWVCMS